MNVGSLANGFVQFLQDAHIGRVLANGVQDDQRFCKRSLGNAFDIAVGSFKEIRDAIADIGNHGAGKGDADRDVVNGVGFACIGVLHNDGRGGNEHAGVENPSQKQLMPRNLSCATKQPLEDDDDRPKKETDAHQLYEVVRPNDHGDRVEHL